MKLRYKHQRFQENAARCVVDAFIGQPKSDGLSNFMVDPGKGDPDGIKFDMEGFGNQEIVLRKKTSRRISVPSRCSKAYAP